MSRTFRFSHGDHDGVDETAWCITELVGGGLLVQAWPDDAEREDRVTELRLRRFGSEIIIDARAPDIVADHQAPALAEINRLKAYQFKLIRAGVPPEHIPPFVLHSSKIEAIFRTLAPEWSDETVCRHVALGYGEFFGVFVAWSAEMDRWVASD